MKLNTRPTNYNELKNRCDNCGHRLSMHKKFGCTVVSGIPTGVDELRCACKRKGS